MVILAFCTPAVPESLDLIRNEHVRAYSENEIEWGAPSLPVTAKTLYRQALGMIANGDREGAIETLAIAADCDGACAAPLFTLSRVELLSGDPAFLPHFVEGIKRSILRYPAQGILAANLAALIAFSLVVALFVTLTALLARHWRFINHSIVENRARRRSFPPARWYIGIIIVGLLFLRLGLALYIAILILAVWAYLGRREKAVIGALAIMLSAASWGARYSNCLAPAVDPQSATRRLALVNESAVDAGSLELIRGITDDRYGADRNFALGTMMYRLGLYGEAQRHFLDAVTARPDFAPAFLNLGNVYFMRGDFDKAIAGYRSAVELDSTSAVASYNLGQAYIKKMLFAQSGVWLERATLLGIEGYRIAHPTVTLRNPPVYEQGFEPRDLWTIAVAEGKSRPNVLLSEMLQPYLLFPFHWLWALLGVSLIAAALMAWKRSDAWRTGSCENCGGPTCLRCEDSQTGIRLCRECAEVVRGLTSVKVMEALLRTRRQKTAGRTSALHGIRMLLFPGIVQTCYGAIGAGCALAFTGGGALGLLIWRGFYFADPGSAGITRSPWIIAAPAAVLACCHLLSYFAKPPQEAKNYRVLPTDAKSATGEPAKRPAAPVPDPWEEYDEARAARRNAAAAAKENARDPEPPERGRPTKPPSPEKAFIGEIEKGTKWH